MRWLAAFALVLTLAPPAQAECGDDGTFGVLLTAGLGVGIGATTSLVSSGIISAADDTRDYDFGIGALVGIAVTSGLTGVYAVYDGATGCEMSLGSTAHVVWSVPIIMFILGSTLPIAVWGAAEDIVPEGTPPPAEMQGQRPGGLVLRF